jgi:hypothetical protein
MAIAPTRTLNRIMKNLLPVDASKENKFCDFPRHIRQPEF